jgi:hypothetical protein
MNNAVHNPFRWAVVACLALSLSLVGCGPEEPSPGAQPDEQPPAETTPETDSTEEEAPGDVQAQGKQCTATCTVVRNPIVAAWCPATVSGYGRTTFLGGCNKACNKAREQAQATALPEGCGIQQCSTSGC